jgi:hypothetical protein
MKKMLLMMWCTLLMFTAFSQTVNISTGTLNTGLGQAEANNWKIVAGPVTGTPFTVASYGGYWQPTPIAVTNARWINPKATTSTDAPGDYTFERTVSFSGVNQVTFTFSIAYDDDLVSLEIVKPGGTVDNITSAVVRSTSPTEYYLSKEIIKTYKCSENQKVDGEYKVRAKVKYVDILGSFLLSGNVVGTQGNCCPCPAPNTNANISICTALGGGTTLSGSAIGASTGLGNGWTLKRVPCDGPKPCKWVPGGIVWQAATPTISIPSSVLIPGCYVLTHYVNRCSKQWNPKDCLSYQSFCFTICDNKLTAGKQYSPGLQANGAKMKITNNGDNEEEPLTEVEQIKN